MKELKEIMQRIREKKQEKKKVHSVYKDLLATSQSYLELLEELTKLKAKKIQLEHAFHDQCTKELEQVERLGLDIKTDVQLLSDMALSLMMKGQTVEVTDENDTKYEPIFKVTFKKAG